MSKIRKPKRTKVSRLAVGQKELTKQESKKVRGGTPFAVTQTTKTNVEGGSAQGSQEEQIVAGFLGSSEYFGRL